ncbi:hypothetical protein K9F17_20935, partial [Stenotrophomonas acidaminiphila]|nr:hypothetical protein [Stenotrophomonas acidaminiphila]
AEATKEVQQAYLAYLQASNESQRKEADKKIKEATQRKDEAEAAFATIRTTIVVPEPSELAETKKKAEEAKAEEKVAKRKYDYATLKLALAKKEV